MSYIIHNFFGIFNMYFSLDEIVLGYWMHAKIASVSSKT